MSIKILQEDIKSGNFKKFYLLYGPEAYLRQQYKEKLIKALSPDVDSINFNRYEGKGIEVTEIKDRCETMPFFADYRTILIEDSGFLKNKCDELADYLKSVPDYVHMIFVEDEVDKRGRIFKALKSEGLIVEFTAQDEKTLMRWAAGILARENLKITQRDMELFITKTGTDMGNIRMELEKLIAYTMGRDVVTADDIEAICTNRIENKIFAMVSAVTAKNQRKALDLYNDLLTLREPPMRILALLSKEFRAMCLAKKMSVENASIKEIAPRIGKPEFAVRNLLTCARSYTIAELEAAERDFADADEAVKTGKLQDKLSVELLIVKYSSARNN